jgi:hypothetical protein
VGRQSGEDQDYSSASSSEIIVMRLQRRVTELGAYVLEQESLAKALTETLEEEQSLAAQREHSHEQCTHRARSV